MERTCFTCRHCTAWQRGGSGKSAIAPDWFRSSRYGWIDTPHITCPMYEEES